MQLESGAPMPRASEICPLCLLFSQLAPHIVSVSVVYPRASLCEISLFTDPRSCSAIAYPLAAIGLFTGWTDSLNAAEHQARNHDRPGHLRNDMNPVRRSRNAEAPIRPANNCSFPPLELRSSAGHRECCCFGRLGCQSWDWERARRWLARVWRDTMDPVRLGKPTQVV